MAFSKKHEALEEVKADCKKNKVAKDAEKKKITEAQQMMDLKRKDGLNLINRKLNEIITNDNISLADKMARL